MAEQISVRFDIPLFKEIEKLAARERRTVAWIVRECCAVYVREQRAGRMPARPARPAA